MSFGDDHTLEATNRILRLQSEDIVEIKGSILALEEESKVLRREARSIRFNTGWLLYVIAVSLAMIVWKIW